MEILVLALIALLIAPILLRSSRASAAQTFMAGGHVHSFVKNGAGQAGPSLGLRAEETTQTSSLGFRMEWDDGRVYRYSYYLTAVGPGKLAAQDFSVTGFASINGKFTNSTGGAKDNYGTTDSIIYLTDTDTFSTADAASIFAGGQFFITDAAGEGYAYPIADNAVGTAAGLMNITLHEALASALDSESSCAIIGHPYRNLAIANNGTDDLVAGIPPRSMSAVSYGWTQTWGWAPVLADASAGTIAAGTIATLSDGVNGAAQPISGGYSQASEALITSDFNFTPIVTEPIIGFFGTAATDTEYTPLFLQLNP